MSFRSLAVGAALSVLSVAGFAGAANAADVYRPEPVVVVHDAGNPFEGFYAGVYAGAATPHQLVLGALVGVNFEVSDSVIIGLEGQGGVGFGNSSHGHFEGLLLARLGLTMSDSALLYAAAGIGTNGWGGTFAVGGGAELLVTDNMGVRGEVLATGPLTGHSGISGVRATLGAIWYMN